MMPDAGPDSYRDDAGYPMRMILSTQRLKPDSGLQNFLPPQAGRGGLRQITSETLRYFTKDGVVVPPGEQSEQIKYELQTQSNLPLVTNEGQVEKHGNDALQTQKHSPFSNNDRAGGVICIVAFA